MHAIYAMHRDLDCYVPCIEIYSFDLNDNEQLEKVFYSIEPDIVLHCAGLINMEHCEKNPQLAGEQNAKVTEYIAKLCGSNTKFIYISSDQVYGDILTKSEECIDLQPLNEYGKSKLLGEKQVKRYCSNYIIIRTNIFGLSVKPGKVSSAEWI